MTVSQYERILREGLSRFGHLSSQRDEIDFELTKLKQFLYATLNMVPDERREELEKYLNAVVGKASTRPASLAESVRRVFDEHPAMSYSVVAIRGELMQLGFDFSGYKSNPLSSIATTLRRMAETGELTPSASEGGTTVYSLSVNEENIRKTTEAFAKSFSKKKA
jgi:hypothetical protein